jgi:hypothetical protein
MVPSGNRKYFFRILGSVIPGSGRLLIKDPSGSFLDFFVTIEKICCHIELLSEISLKLWKGKDPDPDP